MTTLRSLVPDSPAAQTATVQHIITTYLEHAPPGHSADSAKERQRVLSLFCQEFGSRILAELRPYDLLMWIDKHEAWASNWTRNRIKNTIVRPMNWAARMGLIGRNPFAGVSFPSGEAGRDMTDQEFRRLLRAAHAPFRRILIFLRLTGARPIELRRLEWEQISAELRAAVQKIHKTAHSTRRPRRIPLTPTVLKLLAWIKRHQKYGNRFVFLNARSQPWKKRALCQHMERLRTKAALPRDCKLYGTRHAFGTGAILNGVDLATVAELMGHSSIRTTQTYIHLAGQTNHLWAAAEQATTRRKS